MILFNIQASNLKIMKTERPREKIDKDKLVFGKTFTDHMIEIEWTQAGGWNNPLIKPFGPLLLNPSASVFHYATEVFYLAATRKLIFYSALKD